MALVQTMKQTNDFAERALKMMLEKSIPPTPRNFSVWYNYVSGGDPMLKAGIESMLDNNEEAWPAATSELYNRFLSNEDSMAFLHDTADKMEMAINDVNGFLGEANSDVSHFQSKMKSSLQDFSTAKDASGIQDVMQNLVSEARKMQKANKELQGKLELSSAQIDTLQVNLNSARKDSFTDSLTGIANRKMFDVTLARVMRKAVNEQAPLCLVLCDIDFFKKFNDTYGHQIGDHVIKLVATVMHDNVKGSDLAARYGGEEFALILPQTQINHAYGLVEKIRKSIAGRVIRNRHTQEDYGKVTLSIGVSLCQNDDTPEAMIKRADDALYRAKNSGRNCTVLEHEAAQQNASKL